jgi:ribosomal protein S21
MAVNIEVEKNSNESNASILRRFTKKVQGSGILPRVRSIRYATRQISSYKAKVQKLSRLSRKAKIEELIKMGKMADRTDGQYRRKKK